jgi:hypothetical protein
MAGHTRDHLDRALDVLETWQRKQNNLNAINNEVKRVTDDGAVTLLL